MAGLQRASPCNALQGSCNFTNAQMWPRIRNTTLVNPPGEIAQYIHYCIFNIGLFQSFYSIINVVLFYFNCINAGIQILALLFLAMCWYEACKLMFILLFVF